MALDKRLLETDVEISKMQDSINALQLRLDELLQRRTQLLADMEQSAKARINAPCHPSASPRLE